MKTLLCALALLMLPGCADSLIEARRLTVMDGAAYVDDNHERRRQIREKKYALEDEVHLLWMDRARDALKSGDEAAAKEYFDEAYAVLDNAYPALATMELIGEGVEDYGEFRESIWQIRERRREQDNMGRKNDDQEADSETTE